MKETLKKIKLIQYQDTEIEIPKRDFLRVFNHHFSSNKIEIYNDVAKLFDVPKMNYKGIINIDEFTLRKRNHLFDTDKNTSIVKGKISQLGKKTRIETEIQGASNFKLFLYSIFAIGYCYMMFRFSQNYIKKINDLTSLILILIFHSSIIFGLPYFIIRKRMNRMKTEVNNSFIIWSLIMSSIKE